MEIVGLLFIGFIAAWGLLSFGAGKLAVKQGRNFAGWFLLSLILSPFLAVFILLLLGESTSKAVRDTAQTREIVKIRCSNCGDTAREDAKFCPHCGNELQPSSG